MTSHPGILASSTTGKVAIGHHFHFNMKTPFQTGSDQFIMLTSWNTINNLIAIDLAIGLAIQPTIRTPTCWDQLATATDGPAVLNINMPQQGPKHLHGFQPLMLIPAWLAAPLMEANTDDAATLCSYHPGNLEF